MYTIIFLLTAGQIGHPNSSNHISRKGDISDKVCGVIAVDRR